MATKNTEEAVQLQVIAMHAEVFEIGLFDPNSSRQMLPAYGTAIPFFDQFLGFASRMSAAETSTYARVASTD
jgi:hypothetical protein